MAPRRLLPSFAFIVMIALASGCGHDAPAPSTPSSANMPAPPASDPSAPPPAVDPPSTTAPQMAPDVAAISCSHDSDCQLADDYCGSCRCLSLMHGDQPPACTGARVQCFVAPCRGKRAVCQSHTCLALDSGGGGM